MAASLSAWRTRFVERRVRADRILPPLILVPGHRLSHEQKYSTHAMLAGTLARGAERAERF
jgi:hypothetical protein